MAGLDVFEQSLEVRQRIGYLPEDTPIYRDMTVREFLEFVAEVRGMTRDKREARIKEIGGRCGLGDHAGKLIGELSKGYRQRVGLAQAMLHDPDILILDEPTSGLDPNQIVEIRELIKEVGREKTVILSTHILPEVQATCSRMIIISKGKVVADGTPDELRARERGGRYRVVVAANGVPAGHHPHPAGQPDRRRPLSSRSPARTGPIRFAIDATHPRGPAPVAVQDGRRQPLDPAGAGARVRQPGGRVPQPDHHRRRWRRRRRGEAFMSAAVAITKRELRTYFNSPVAYIVATVFMLLAGFLFFNTLFIERQAEMRGYFGTIAPCCSPSSCRR